MPKNQSPKVQHAKDFAEKFRQNRVIILYQEANDGRIGYASYGKTATECKKARKIADIAFDAIYKAYAEGRLP